MGGNPAPITLSGSWTLIANVCWRLSARQCVVQLLESEREAWRHDMHAESLAMVLGWRRLLPGGGRWPPPLPPAAAAAPVDSQPCGAGLCGAFLLRVQAAASAAMSAGAISGWLRHSESRPAHCAACIRRVGNAQTHDSKSSSKERDKRKHYRPEVMGISPLLGPSTAGALACIGVATGGAVPAGHTTAVRQVLAAAAALQPLPLLASSLKMTGRLQVQP